MVIFLKKEILICVIVVILIVVLNAVTEKNTENVLGEISSDFSEMHEYLEQEDDEKLKGKINEVIEIWEKESDKLSFYIEHEELEKVEMYIWEINSNIETKEYSMAMQSLDTCDFIINHIMDKNKLELKNIF